MDDGQGVDVTCILTEKECALCNTLQVRQLSSQDFSNKVKVSLFDKMYAFDFFPPRWVRVHSCSISGLFPYTLNDACFEGGRHVGKTRAKPIIYLKYLRSQTSLMKPIIPAQRELFHFQIGRFYFCKSIISLWITLYLKKRNVPRES